MCSFFAVASNTSFIDKTLSITRHLGERSDPGSGLVGSHSWKSHRETQTHHNEWHMSLVCSATLIDRAPPTVQVLLFYEAVKDYHYLEPLPELNHAPAIFPICHLKVVD